MKISVQAKAGARRAAIERTGEGEFAVAVVEPPEGGRANRAIARAIAEYFGVAPSRVRLVTGAAARKKIFEIV